MRTDFEGGRCTGEGNRRGQANTDCAAPPWRGNGLPVSALIIAEEKVIIGVDGEPLVGARGHGEDGEMTGQRTRGGENSLHAIHSEPAHRCAGTRRWGRKGAFRCRWLRRLDLDASKDTAHGACHAAGGPWPRLGKRRWLGCRDSRPPLRRTLGQWRHAAEGFRRRDFSWGR